MTDLLVTHLAKDVFITLVVNCHIYSSPIDTRWNKKGNTLMACSLCGYMLLGVL